MTHRKFLPGIMLVLAVAGLAGCTGNAQDNGGAIADGKMLAERQCSACHAVGTTGTSPLPEAPLFRTILSRYRSDVLEEELVENIKIGHSTMPEFQFNPAAVGDLIAYLQSIQQQPPTP